MLLAKFLHGEKSSNNKMLMQSFELLINLEFDMVIKKSHVARLHTSNYKHTLKNIMAVIITYSQVPNTSNAPNRSNGDLFGQKLIIVTPK